MSRKPRFTPYSPTQEDFQRERDAREFRDEMLPASSETMGKAYEEIGRGDAVWQDEAGNWHLSAGQVVRFHAHNGTMGVPPERLLASGQSNWTEEAKARLTEWTEPCHEMAGEGIQAPLDYARDPIAFARHLIKPPKMHPWQKLAAAGRIVFAWARR